MGTDTFVFDEATGQTINLSEKLRAQRAPARPIGNRWHARATEKRREPARERMAAASQYQKRVRAVQAIADAAMTQESTGKLPTLGQLRARRKGHG